MALAMFMHGIAWLLNDLFFDGQRLGRLPDRGAVLAAGRGGAGLFAYRQFQAGAPPTPELAIEEAKRVKETFEAEPEGTLGGAQAPIGGQRAVSDGTDVYVSGRRRAGRARGARAGRALVERRFATTSRPPASSSATRSRALRGRVTELTDWRRQVREHQRELVIGAAVAGFVVGGIIALRRRGGSG